MPREQGCPRAFEERIGAFSVVRSYVIIQSESQASTILIAPLAGQLSPSLHSACRTFGRVLSFLAQLPLRLEQDFSQGDIVVIQERKAPSSTCIPAVVASCV